MSRKRTARSRKGDGFRTPTAGFLIASASRTADGIIVDGRCVEGNIVPGDALLQFIEAEPERHDRWEVDRTEMYDREVKFIPTGHVGRVHLSGPEATPCPAQGVLLTRPSFHASADRD